MFRTASALARQGLVLLMIAGCNSSAPGGPGKDGAAGVPDATRAPPPGDDAAVEPDAQLQPDPDAMVVADSGVAADATAPDDDATTGNPDATNADATPGQDAAATPDASAPDAAAAPDAGPVGGRIGTVFLILMENHNWADISGNTTEAPYINNTLLPMGAHAESYKGDAHPSEPNYLWLVAGQRFGIRNDNPPSSNHQASHEHLAYQLNQAGISWREYAEDIPGTECPLSDVANYRPKHNPFVFFDDLTGANDRANADCIAHNRPYSELADDLLQNRVARFNFLTPNLCNDMHDACGGTSLTHGDTWLSTEIPRIMASQAYQNNGLIIVTWDESEFALSCLARNCAIGMIVVSPLAKGNGYSNTINYDHSSTLKSLQRIFGVQPFLGAAANAQTQDLADLFTTFP